MLKVVLDTNILVSSLIRNGKPRSIWNFILTGKLQLISSKQILDEFIEVISREKFRKYITENEVKIFLETVKDIGNFVRVKHNFKIIREDPDDDKILNAAYDGKVDYIVSGDPHLLKLEEFRGIKIITPSQMLGILK